MFTHKFHEQASLKTYANWFILSFLAGNINAGGYLAAGRFVSHITGFATLSGISFERGKIFEAVGVLTIPAYFLSGVMVAGYLTEKKQLAPQKNHHYAPVMGLVTLCLALGIMGGSLNLFGGFGESNITHNYFLLALLCCACGLQNAAITSASGSTVRTTHLTGLTTDLGLGIIRAEIHNPSPELRTIERRANLLRVGTIFAFTLGSFIGAIFYVNFEYLGFLLPFGLSIYASLSAAKVD